MVPVMRSSMPKFAPDRGGSGCTARTKGPGWCPRGVTGKSGGGVVVHVPDVDAHHDRVRASGAEILYRPRDEPYGQREYGVRDPEGHVWWIATPIASENM
jgi:uncharacterized glyoxalase superfamily protein PhnB